METTALVVGGGVGGLAAAAVALRHFDRVTIIDRDDLTGARVADESIEETKKRRAGAPQYNEPHIFTAGGLQALEAVAPGITAELQRRGAAAYDPGKGIYVFDFGCAFKRGMDTGLTVLAASRRLINETLQDTVVAAGGERLTIRDKTSVKGLLWGDDGGVNGVILNGGEELCVDLVLWAGGRRSHLALPKWLGERGVAVPSPLKVDVKVSYAARWMLLPSDFDPENEFYTAVVHSTHAEMRKGMALVVEGGRVQFTMIGFGGERAPLDHEGWMAWARSLPDPAVADLAQRCNPDGPISRYASAPGVAMRYHRAKMPRGLAVLGDAAVASNPVYGQGMTLAAKGARVLDSVLQKAFSGRDNPVERRESARAVGPMLHQRLFWGMQPLWQMCAVEDMRIETAEVSGLIRPPAVAYAVTDVIMSVCGEDERVATAMMRVLQCVDSPVAVVGALPRVVAVVARRWLRRAWGWAAGPTVTKGE